MSFLPLGYGHGVMQRWKANSVKGAFIFGSGIFLTTRFLFHEAWGIALVLGLVFGLCYGLMLNHLHREDD
jgi:hypothetical protein